MNRPARRKIFLVAMLLVAAVIVAAAREFFDYSAAPSESKSSDFIYPPNAEQTKPTTLVQQVQPAQNVPFEQVGGWINDASH